MVSDSLMEKLIYPKGFHGALQFYTGRKRSEFRVRSAVCMTDTKKKRTGGLARNLSYVNIIKMYLNPTLKKSFLTLLPIERINDPFWEGLSDILCKWVFGFCLSLPYPLTGEGKFSTNVK